ncbi:hypothetical protein [Synechococcus sp. H65.1]|uniref:hypothetical protein n=1 Tax=unclassified Synechococcus TaxID=2626047 RepID=UPI0039C07FE1
MSERLERVEAILEVLAQQTLANAQNTEVIRRAFEAIAQNTEAIGRAFEAIDKLRARIAELRDVVEQQNRAITYLLSQD